MLYRELSVDFSSIFPLDILRLYGAACSAVVSDFLQVHSATAQGRI